MNWVKLFKFLGVCWFVGCFLFRQFRKVSAGFGVLFMGGGIAFAVLRTLLHWSVSVNWVAVFLVVGGFMIILQKQEEKNNGNK